jgi:hypothetical protein
LIFASINFDALVSADDFTCLADFCGVFSAIALSFGPPVSRLILHFQLA